MPSLFDQKKIMISGATHGIGKATAELFCRKGWNVYGISSNKDDMRGVEMMQKMPNFHYYRADICCENEILSVFEQVGKVDAVFNNAGIGIAPQNIENIDISQTSKVIETNLIGVLIGLKYALKYMDKGVVVNNASLSAFKAATGADLSYSASKAGVVAATAEAAAQTKYIDKVSFFCIAPGYIETRMTVADNPEIMQKKMPSQCMGKANKVAKLVYHIVVNHCVFTSGQCFHIDGGAFLI